ncbi:UNVERIFIED_CONTAM: hypothetical protein PYX00_005694 [Menopon gallinae]|uniref:Gag-pol polyprotein n=1 Tax=Menopon gallinae TaxID=328185 RepID=A0AAW2HSC1_9NEOP
MVHSAGDAVLLKQHSRRRTPVLYVVTSLRNGDTSEALRGNDVSDNLLRTLWTDYLGSSNRFWPRKTQTPLDQLAELADRVYMAAAASKTPASYPEYIEALKTELRKEIREELRQAHARRRSRSRSESRSSSEYDPSCGTCWYHWKYKSAAKKCVEPCNKGQARPSVNAATADGQETRRLFVKDHKLVDTGADISVYALSQDQRSTTNYWRHFRKSADPDA